jgi:hypothetical protein
MATRTARINAVRGILREQGVLFPVGAGPALRAIPALLEDAENVLAAPLGRTISLVYEEVRQLDDCIGALERELRALADADPIATRLREIPGIGLLTATALVGTVGHVHVSSRAPVCKLAGTDTTRIFQRRPPAARWHQQTRRCVSSVFAHARGPRCAPCRPSAHESPRVIDTASSVGAHRAAATRSQQSHNRRR